MTLAIVALAWMYVVVMMALAEALAPNGTILGAMFTLLLYGVAPLALVLYLMGTPMRLRRRTEREIPGQEADPAAQAEAPPQSRSQTAAAARPVTPSRRNE